MAKQIIDFPDGKGGMRKVEAEPFAGQKHDEERAAKAFDKAISESAWIRVGRAAEAFNKFHRAYATEEGLTKEEFMAAVYLENLNMREFTPKEDGGSEYYDHICKLTWEEFERKKQEEI